MYVQVLSHFEFCVLLKACKKKLLLYVDEKNSKKNPTDDQLFLSGFFFSETDL